MRWPVDGADAMDMQAFVLANDPRLSDARMPIIGAPAARSLTLATAYRATDPSKPAFIQLNLLSTSSNALLAATQAVQAGEVVIGSANTVAAGTGTKVALHRNAQGGVLVVGLTITQDQGQSVSFLLPIGWYFAVRQTTGSNLSIVSAFEHLLG